MDFESLLANTSDKRGCTKAACFVSQFGDLFICVPYLSPLFPFFGEIITAYLYFRRCRNVTRECSSSARTARRWRSGIFTVGWHLTSLVCFQDFTRLLSSLHCTYRAARHLNETKTVFTSRCFGRLLLTPCIIQA